MAKLFFAPLPPRAIGDRRLTELHLRVLACIALHDRMAGALKKGQGCWSSPRRMAEECASNISNVSTATGKLIEWGYIRRADHPEDKRKRVLHVVYDEGDTAFVKRQSVLPTGKQPPGDRLPATQKVVCPRDEIAKVTEALTDPNIFCEAEDIPQKGKKYSPEGARFSGIDENLGAKLAKFEREFKAGEISKTDLEVWADWLADVHLNGDSDDPNIQRAGRLAEDAYYAQEGRA